MIRLVAALLTLTASAAQAQGDKQMTPPYPAKSSIDIHGKSTGFFHVERIGGIWWVIDPAGNAFYVIGTDHVNYNVHWCEALGYAPYHKNCQRIYGSEEKWADHAVGLLRSWGFNSLGANNSSSTRYKGLAHMEFLAMGQGFSSIEYITEKTFWTGFPDVFSSKWEQFCDQTAQTKCAPHKDDPWLIGYFIDNELEWFGKTGSLFADAFRRPAHSAAKTALVEMLKSRHGGDIAQFNKVWQTNAASFDELLDTTDPPNPATARARSDVTAFARLCADRYFAVSCAAIRRHDPNHMVLGCRFAGRAPDVWAEAGKYCDIVSVNCYRTLDLEKGILTDGFEQDLATWHKEAKRPLMITEWSFPGLDAGLPSAHGAGQRVRTQDDRARAFTIFQKLLFATPFVVGSDYFMWVDEPELGISKSFPEDSNYGLVDVNDKPYGPITRAATNLHARAYDIHSGRVADVYAKPSGKAGFVVGNSGRAATSCKISLWIDGVLTERAALLRGGESQPVNLADGMPMGPGGHLLICRVDQADPLVEPNPADNEAVRIEYVPGLPAIGKPGARVPIVVANPTDKRVDNAPVTIKLSDLPASCRSGKLDLVRSTDGQPAAVPFQVVEGDCLILLLDLLPPRTCATLFACPGAMPGAAGRPRVIYHRKNAGFEIDNGVLRITKLDLSSGTAFDRVELGGVEVGSFVPLVFQQADRGCWVRPSRVEKIEASNGPAALVLDMTFRYDPDNTGPRAYRAKCRFVVCPGKPYFSSRYLWIENTDARAWTLESYFHYALSNIAGDSGDDVGRTSYWFDSAAGLCYGVEAPPGFAVSMWKDAAGAEHADTYRSPYLERVLAEGERFAADDDPVYIIAGTEDDFARTAAQLRTSSGLSVKVFKPEAVK